MSDIATKLTYLNETKSQLKDMINYGLPTENQITNETTFRNYVKSIFEAFIESLRDSTTLYTNLPKISGNGTQITLNDTANAPMRITLNPTAISQDGTPTPSSPQNIHTISGDNSVVVYGKNLVDTSLVYRGFSYNLPVGETKTATLYTGNLVEIDSNKVIKYLSETYDWSSISVISNPLSQGNYKLNVVREDGSPILTGGTTVYICEKTAQNTYKILNVVNVQQSQQDFWVPTNQNISIARDNLYVVVCFSNNNATINNSYVKFSIQLEKGSTATTYEPYVSQTAQLNLGNIEYCKIGDYEDRIFKNVVGDVDYDSSRELGKWYLKKNIGKVVLDGSETWNERTNSSGTKQFYAPTDLPVNSVLDATQKCTHFNKYRQSLFNYGAVGEFAILTNNRIFYGGVEDTLLLEDFKNSLASNNLIVYCVLATPTYTQITGTLETQLENIYKNMLSYKGTTNVSQINNDLPFVLGVSALEDLS